MHLHNFKRKNPKRPKLETLHSVDDIKHWVPSLKKDIDFYLKQSQVPCYPERKIQEINKKINYLKHEYEAFVRKLEKLDPSMKDIPWTERSYQPCRAVENSSAENQQPSKSTVVPSDFVPIDTPILDQDFSLKYSNPSEIQTVIPDFPDTMDSPLQFVIKTNEEANNCNKGLNLPYSDSDDENGDDT
ncbi:uncharacterized protein LOC125669296 isoform X2 [Ostrea edulis]|uniref:uncharacterized protein LOC125669296 isoform X2 n=1 Tax=Ostrea edulis TaxID=37623 RepID=UPI0024AF79AC|nr:uncharacterized protein LOC125669296 isoform X2 [Ostrea edulis]